MSGAIGTLGLGRIKIPVAESDEQTIRPSRSLKKSLGRIRSSRIFEANLIRAIRGKRSLYFPGTHKRLSRNQ